MNEHLLRVLADNLDRVYDTKGPVSYSDIRDAADVVRMMSRLRPVAWRWKSRLTQNKSGYGLTDDPDLFSDLRREGMVVMESLCVMPLLLGG